MDKRRRFVGRRWWWIALALVAIGLAGCGSHAGATGATGTTGAAAGATTTSQPSTVASPVGLKTAYVARVHTDVLVDSAGYSLYIFLPDDRRSVTCTGTCALTWPPLTLDGGDKPHLGKGVHAGLVGMDKDPEGGTQVVTYDGWPLYTYTSDVRPGMASGQGIDLNGGPWYLIRPDGKPIEPTVGGTG
jgi:predicted lipoprotein with Yx(FWY)xxD motif